MTLIDQFKKSFLKLFKYDPTFEQSQLIDQLTSYYFDQNSAKLFIINGYAGTGKTTILSAFVKTLFAQKKKAVLLAPTGRAAKVIAGKANSVAYTIHKKIYRKESVPGGGVQLVVGPNLHTNTVFIIDEASMIANYSMQNDGSISSRNLLDDVIHYVYSGRNCFAIFLGDNAQLPPVGSDFSPALNLKYMNEHYFNLKISYFELKTVLRQAEDSEILSNATMLRSSKDHVYPQFSVKKSNELIRLNGADFQEELESAYDLYGREEVIVITRSNKSANVYNHEIRNRILWFEDQISNGDYLMVVKNNYHWLNDVKQGSFIANGEIVKVERLRGAEKIYDLEFMDVEISFPNQPELDQIQAKLLLDTLSIDEANLNRKKMKELFFKVEQDYSWEKNKKKRYERVMSDPYFNALQVKFAYAVTCHKSQGGQWSCAFVDQGYLTEEMLNRDYFRWMYTAFTRPTDKLYLVNFHDSFFTT
jgi:exodeoxyribonuclease-5